MENQQVHGTNFDNTSQIPDDAWNLLASRLKKDQNCQKLMNEAIAEQPKRPSTQGFTTAISKKLGLPIPPPSRINENAGYTNNNYSEQEEEDKYNAYSQKLGQRLTNLASNPMSAGFNQSMNMPINESRRENTNPYQAQSYQQYQTDPYNTSVDPYQQVQYQQPQYQPSAANQAQGINYEYIKSLIDSAIEKQFSIFEKKLLSEQSSNSLKMLHVGKALTFLANNGDIYKAKLTFLGNKNNNKQV